MKCNCGISTETKLNPWLDRVNDVADRCADWDHNKHTGFRIFFLGKSDEHTDGLFTRIKYPWRVEKHRGDERF